MTNDIPRTDWQTADATTIRRAIALRLESNGVLLNPYDVQLKDLGLQKGNYNEVRAHNSLARSGVTTVGDVLKVLDGGTDALLSLRNFGEKSLDVLIARLTEKGFYPHNTAILPDYLHDVEAALALPLPMLWNWSIIQPYDGNGVWLAEIINADAGSAGHARHPELATAICIAWLEYKDR